MNPINVSTSRARILLKPTFDECGVSLTRTCNAYWSQ